MNRVVFVGGIHGAGKTTLSSRLTAVMPVVHVTAGALIRATAPVDHLVTVGPGDKAVPDVDSNQVLLLRGLASLRKGLAEPKAILLDGHFCLLDSSGHVTEISLAVFEAIRPSAVILVSADAGVIHQRLVERGGASPAESTLRRLAECEARRAREVCDALAIPLKELCGTGDPAEATAQAVAFLLALSPR